MPPINPSSPKLAAPAKSSAKKPAKRPRIGRKTHLSDTQELLLNQFLMQSRQIAEEAATAALRKYNDEQLDLVQASSLQLLQAQTSTAESLTTLQPGTSSVPYTFGEYFEPSAAPQHQATLGKPNTETMLAARLQSGDSSALPVVAATQVNNRFLRLLRFCFFRA